MTATAGQIIPDILQALGAGPQVQLQAVIDLTKVIQRFANLLLIQKLPVTAQAELAKLVAEGKEARAFAKMSRLLEAAAVRQAQKEALEGVLSDYFGHIFANLNEPQKQRVGKVLEKYRDNGKE